MEWGGMVLRVGGPVAAAMAGGAAEVCGRARGATGAQRLVFFAGGAFGTIALLDLGPEAFELAGWSALLAAALALLAVGLLARRTVALCPCGHEGHPAPALTLGPLLLAVLALHCILDGLALGEGRHAPNRAGEVLSLAVLVHKLPEGVAIAAICRTSGLAVRGALMTTLGIESFTFVGALLGLALGLTARPVLGLALGIVTGAFLYLMGVTLRRIPTSTTPRLDAAFAAAGALIVLAARLFSG